MIGKLTALCGVALLVSPAALAQAISGPVDAEVVVIERDEVESVREAGLIRDARPTSDPYSWPSPSDYPAEALSTLRMGEVEVEVEVHVEADDRHHGCTTRADKAQHPALSSAACPIVLKYGQFRHALTVDGSPRAGIVPLAVSFRLYPAPRPAQVFEPPVGYPVPQNERPKRLARPVDPDARVLRDASPVAFPHRYPSVFADVGADGAVTGCRIFISAEADRGDVRMCEQAMRIRFEPELDPSGKAVASEETIEFILDPR